MSVAGPVAMQSSGRAIVFILVGMTCISVNDLLIKFLSGGYPLHQIVMTRASIGILVSLVFLRLEGGVSLLKTDRPILHTIRAGMIVMANMAFFAALAVMPLGLRPRCSSWLRCSSPCWRSRFWGNPSVVTGWPRSWSGWRGWR